MKKTIIGVVIMVVSVVAIFAWETFGREEFLFDEIVVLNQSVEAHTQITADMLAVKKAYQPGKEVYNEKNYEEIVGKEATQYIPLGTELYERYFCEPSLTVSEENDEYVFSLAITNLYSYPRSITRGDKITLYHFRKELLKTTVLHVRDSDGNEVSQSDNRQQTSGLIGSIEIKVNKSEAATLSNLISKGDSLSIVYN